MATKEDPSSRGAGALKTSIVASDYLTLAFHLTHIKGLEYNEIVSGVVNKPRSVPEIWNEIVTLFSVSQQGDSKQELLSAAADSARNETDETNLDELTSQAAFHNSANELTIQVPYEHANETQFSIALFKALQNTLLTQQAIIESCSPTLEPEQQFIVFKYGGPGTHSIAITRDVNEERKPAAEKMQSTMIVDKMRRKRQTTSSSGLVAKTRLNYHCPCLVERRRQDGTLKLVDCFSVLQLNTDDANCCAVFDGSSDIHEQIELDGRHGAAAQAMLYSLEWVLPGLARIGQLGTEFPWAVIVGKRPRLLAETTKRAKTETEQSISNRWMSGNIYVPNECGSPYQYTVTGYGGRMNEVATVDSVLVLDALSMYLETILFGLKAAKACLDYRGEYDNNRWPKPCSVSGKKVVIFGHEIPSQLRSSATVGRFLNGGGGVNDDKHWDAAQGELFTGKLNLYALCNNLAEEDENNFTVFGQMIAMADISVDVVLKVTSRAVHNYLTDPRDNLDALKHLARRPVAALAISKVLYAVHPKNPVGLITIMADLSLQNYKVLRPKYYSGVQAIDLWKAFEQVVNNVLVHMATYGVIHADIRPGWEVTSNILCKVEDGNGQVGGVERIVMQVIDYESVVALDKWILPTTKDHRYMKRDPKWNAFTYLWWQCANLAHAWSGRYSQESMIRVDVRSLIKDGSWKEKWLPGVNVPGDTKLTRESFQTHFDSLAKIFSHVLLETEEEIQNK